MGGDGAQPQSAVQDSGDANDRLDSWKEIAAYLKREVRTVQRWEKNLGLPIRRLGQGKLGPVFAYKHELDAWWRESQSSLDVEDRKPNEDINRPDLNVRVVEPSENAEKQENSETDRTDGLRRGAIFAFLLVFALALPVGIFRTQIIDWITGTNAKVTLAVRPFKNLSGDASQDYVAEGLTEEMITRLGQLHPEEMGVIRLPLSSPEGPGPSNPVRGLTPVGVNTHGDYVLEGGVRHSGQRVAITAQLIHVSDQTQIWGESYERDLQDVLQMQSEVAEAIARAVLTKLPHAQPPARQVNPEAYLAYLQGRYFWSKRTEVGFAKAITLFERSIQIDPTYAPPYAGLADCYQLLGSAPYSTLTPSEAFPKAEAAARKALELDRTLAEAHVPLGISQLVYDRNFPEARSEFERALQLRPSYATAHQFFGYYLTAMGRSKEAIAERKKALELDPISPLLHSALGEAYYHARRFDLSIAENVKALDLDPTYAIALVNIGRGYEQLGMHQQARDAFQKILAAVPDDPAILSLLGHEYAISGDTSDAKKALVKMQGIAKNKYVPAVYFAVIYTGLNQKDDAFKWLDKAFEERCEYLVYLGSEPLADPLRGDPRFTRLLIRLGLKTESIASRQTP